MLGLMHNELKCMQKDLIAYFEALFWNLPKRRGKPKISAKRVHSLSGM
jgi:hypothetical protein